MSITRLVPKRDPDVRIERLWLVFFGEAERPAWWTRLLRPGFRHVCACAWFHDQQRWVYYDPTRRGTVVKLYRDDEFGPRLTRLLATSTCVIRIASNHRRSSTPFGWWCTGAVKALLGVRSGALSPLALCRHLLRNGGEIVDLPEDHCEDVEPVQQT